jgi:hydroxyacylglutathione hydrolase
MDVTIAPIPTLKDNYVWAMVHQSKRRALVVDPGEALPVIRYLDQHQLILDGVLITHHHWDHTNGITELIQHYPAPVYASPRSHLSGIAHTSTSTPLEFEVFPSFEIIDIPGHTLDHIAYYAPGILFCGDTLFSAGCGRVFEGTVEQMYRSLQTIMALPDDTMIYCAHEYTLNNLHFAQQVEPENQAISEHMRSVIALRQQNIPSLPALLKREKNINPFLRCHMPQVIQHAELHAGQSLQQGIEVFRELRQWKDAF